MIHILRRRNWLTRRVILAGNPQNIKEILAVAQRETWLGYYVVGALLPEGTAAETWTCRSWAPSRTPSRWLMPATSTS